MIWIPYLLCSLATSAVLLSGWSACGLSRSVCKFHVPSTRGTTFAFFVFKCKLGSPPAAVSWSEEVRQTVFKTHFLAPFPCQGVSSVVLNRAAQLFRLLKHSIPASVQIGEQPSGHSHLCAGSQLQLPVYPYLLLHWFLIATGLWLSDIMWCHDLHKTWIIVKVKESCTYVSLTPLSKTIQIQQQEQVKMAGDS